MYIVHEKRENKMRFFRFFVFGIFAMFIGGVVVATEESDHVRLTSKNYVDTTLGARQDIIPAQSGAKAVTTTSNAGEIAPRDVKTNLGSNTNDAGLPTVGAVNTALNGKQDEIPAVNANTVITYTGTAGEIGRKGIYQDTGTYTAQQDNLIDAGTFNAALKNGLDNEFVCVDRDPDSGNCWLWKIHNATEYNVSLPSEYTPLMYIEATGTQYINTGVVLDGEKSRVVMDFQASLTSSNNSLFGARTSTTSKAFSFRIDSSNKWSAGYNTTTDAISAADEDRHTVDFDKNVVKLDGTTIKTFTSASFQTPSTIGCAVGAIRATSGSLVYYGNTKIYSFKIYTDDVLTIDLVPARRSSDNAVGMYDRLSGTFFTNAGSGTFGSGREISNTVYIPQNQSAQNQ